MAACPLWRVASGVNVTVVGNVYCTVASDTISDMGLHLAVAVPWPTVLVQLLVMTGLSRRLYLITFIVCSVPYTGREERLGSTVLHKIEDPCTFGRNGACQRNVEATNYIKSIAIWNQTFVHLEVGPASPI